MRITQLVNDKDKPVANHFVISFNVGVDYLQSYDSIVAKVEEGLPTTLGRDWDYSPTTLRHVKTFLQTSKSADELRVMIDSGDIVYDKYLDLEKD